MAGGKTKISLAALALTLLLQACASTKSEYSNLRDAGTAMHRPVDVYLNIQEQQNDSYKISPDSSAGHAAAASSGNLVADIVAHLAAEAIIQSAFKTTIEYQDPLLNFTQDYDFSGQFRERLKQVLDTTDWLKESALTVHDGLFTKDERAAVLANQNASLLVNATYSFSHDYRTLYMDTRLELWPGTGTKTAAYKNHYTFCSSESETTGADLEARLDTWSVDDAKRFRRTLYQAIEQSIYMVQRDLQAKGVSEQAGSLLNKVNDTGLCRPHDVSGEIVAEPEGYILIHSETGRYFSVRNPAAQAVKAPLIPDYQAILIPHKNPEPSTEEAQP